MISVFTKADEISQFITHQKASGKTIGFVPTMGALHAGHISLIEYANAQCDLTVASIFVNPTQFNDPKDLKNYPRPLHKDIFKLVDHHTDVLFLPEVEEIYNKDLDHRHALEFGSMLTVMEGKHRPGHFEGVIDVVHRLLHIVSPHLLFMGQKDFQQFSLIDSMIHQLDLETKLVVCPIIRESNGLAMSSRNARLDPEQREKASILFEMLQFAKRSYQIKPLSEIKIHALATFEKEGFRPEYFEFVDGYSLKSLKEVEDTDYLVVCTAVWVGGVRLIDNMILKQNRNKT